MGTFIVRVKSIEKATHDVLRIATEKPSNYQFEPGQATDLSINKQGWEKKKRPFTFTSRPNDDDLEFTIKTYPQHNGVTNELLSLKPNDELIIEDPWGSINYKGEGVFIAGGAGVTPFISIFRQLHSQNKIGDNKLVCANKKQADIINAKEFERTLGKNFINILSDEVSDKYANGFITEEFLGKIITGVDKYVYVCGPPAMMKAAESQLGNLNVKKDRIIKEEF